MEDKVKRPFIIEMDEAKKMIIGSVNAALQKIPCYFVDMILTEIETQVKQGAYNELQIARAQIEKQGEK